MRYPDREALNVLTAPPGGPCASIFFPTHRVGKGVQQGRIRFTNLLREVERQLRAGGRTGSAVHEMLEPAQRLLRDDGFWSHQAEGLAVFLSSGGMMYYRLPMVVEELVVVGDRYYLRPLLPLMNGDGQFYILAIDQKQARLYEGHRYAIEEVAVPAFPDGLLDVVGTDWEERALQSHTATSRRSGGPRQALFHGQGAGSDEAGDELLRYLRRIDDALIHAFPDSDNPVVIAAVKPVIAAYRQVTKHRHVLAEGIEGNPSAWTATQLQARAWPMVAPRFDAAQRRAAERYADLLGTGRASADLREVVLAAADGRIDVLFVGGSERRWGRFHGADRQVELHDGRVNGDDDLLDVAAFESLSHGGTVYARAPDAVPGGEALAAIFRY